MLAKTSNLQTKVEAILRAKTFDLSNLANLVISIKFVLYKYSTKCVCNCSNNRRSLNKYFRVNVVCLL